MVGLLHITCSSLSARGFRMRYNIMAECRDGLEQIFSRKTECELIYDIDIKQKPEIFHQAIINGIKQTQRILHFITAAIACTIRILS